MRIVLLWILWCFLHSLLLTHRVRTRLCRDNTQRLAAYRLAYNCFAVFSFVLLAAYTLLQSQQVLFSFPGYWKLLQIILTGYGLLMFYLGTRAYDLGHFLGLHQLRNYLDGIEQPALYLCRQGILNYVRHPWYSGGFALIWGMGPITDINIQVKVILSVYLIAGAALEEQRLKKELGKPYIMYCQEVPMFFPWKRKQPQRK